MKNLGTIAGRLLAGVTCIVGIASAFAVWQVHGGHREMVLAEEQFKVEAAAAALAATLDTDAPRLREQLARAREATGLDIRVRVAGIDPASRLRAFGPEVDEQGERVSARAPLSQDEDGIRFVEVEADLHDVIAELDAELQRITAIAAAHLMIVVTIFALLLRRVTRGIRALERQGELLEREHGEAMKRAALTQAACERDKVKLMRRLVLADRGLCSRALERRKVVLAERGGLSVRVRAGLLGVASVVPVDLQAREIAFRVPLGCPYDLPVGTRMDCSLRVEASGHTQSRSGRLALRVEHDDRVELRIRLDEQLGLRPLSPALRAVMEVRRALRVPGPPELAVELLVGGDWLPCGVRDLSVEGLGLVTRLDPATLVGLGRTVRIRGGVCDERVEARADIAWVKGPSIGLRLRDRALEPLLFEIVRREEAGQLLAS